MSPQSLRTAYAKSTLREHVLHKYTKRYGGNPKSTELPPLNAGAPNRSLSSTPPKSPKIGIIGAGASGLAVAKFIQEAGVPFESIEILEASSRHGGRCYTYDFVTGPDCPHNYYDIGAMRIPELDTMSSTFAMIKNLNAEGQNVELAEYYYDNSHSPSLYAYGKLPSKSYDGYDKWTTFMTNLLKNNGFDRPDNFDTAFWNFVNQEPSPGQLPPDSYSTRAYLMCTQGFSYQETEIAETFDTSTGLFDQAFMESLCDFYDFQNKVKWWRVNGGMQKLTDALLNVVTAKGATYSPNTPVIALTNNVSTDQIDVTYTDVSTGKPAASPKSYDVVFNTTSFGCLAQMDLQGLDLDVWPFTGIRTLSYDRATKVAIKFKSPWWINQLTKNGGPPGGVSSSDLPISNVVYPSWNDGLDTPHVIIVSYSWAQDATRLSSRIAHNGKEESGPEGLANPLITLLFQNLQAIWAGTDSTITVEYLQSLYLAHHSYAWAHDPYTADAFALFGPGQFSQMYSQFLQPFCNNKLWICGEATSVHHAWISGAFDAAAVAVNGWAHANGNVDAKKRLKASALAGGKGQVPPEMDETAFYWNVELAQQRENDQMKVS